MVTPQCCCPPSPYNALSCLACACTCAGWISETSKRGTVLVLRPGSEHGYMYLLRAAPVRAQDAKYGGGPWIKYNKVHV